LKWVAGETDHNLNVLCAHFVKATVLHRELLDWKAVV